MKLRSLIPSLLSIAVASSAAFADPCKPTFDVTVGTPGSPSTVTLLYPTDYFSPGTQRMVVGGNIATLGGVPGMNGVGVWDGTTFSPLASGLTNGASTFEVLSAQTFGGKLYIGGQFSGAVGGPASRAIIRWNGTAFETVNADTEASAVAVRSMAVYKNELYIGGSIPRVGTLNTNGIAKLNATGDDFLPVGAGILTGAFIWDMVVFNDGSGEKLYVCGNFTRVFNDITGEVAGTRWIARWDGTQWESVGGGIVSGGATSYPKDLIVFDDGTGPALYTAGGRSTASGAGIESAVHKWNGAQWAAVPGFHDAILDTASTISAAGLTNYGGGTTILAQVRFSEIGGANARQSLVRLENGRFKLVPGTLFGTDSVQEIATISDPTGPKTWIAGSFTSVQGHATNRLAIITGCTQYCPADFNEDGIISIDDLFLYINAYFTGCP